MVFVGAVAAPAPTSSVRRTCRVGLQLCRHRENLRQLDATYRKALLDAIEGYYRRREKVTLPQAYLRYALQQALS